MKCQVSLQAVSSAIDSGGGNDAITVSTQPECAWTASSGTTWISSLTPRRQGSGRVEFQAAANPAATMRRGDIAVNDQHVQVEQKPAACRYEIAPSNQTIGAAGGTIGVAVTTLAGCSWEVGNEAPWIAITGTSGDGSGNVSLRVAPNAGAARTASVVIAGQTFTLTQSSAAAPAAPACVFSLERPAQNAEAAGGSVSVGVSAAAGCSWTAVSTAPWLTVASGGTGAGSGTVTATVAANPGAARSGSLTIAGQTFTVNQAAAAAAPAPAPSCSFSMASTGQSMSAGGGAGNVAVTTSAGCAWTAGSNALWITLCRGRTRAGPGPSRSTWPRIPAAPGPAPSQSPVRPSRSVKRRPLRRAATFSVAPGSQSIAAGGGNGPNVMVSTSPGCAWTASSNAAWITLTSAASASGAGTVTYRVAANTGPDRTGTLTIAGRTFTVTQASGCTYAINPTKQSVNDGESQGGPVTVSAAAGCGWTAASHDSWITITAGATGSGNGTVRFRVAVKRREEANGYVDHRWPHLHGHSGQGLGC